MIVDTLKGIALAVYAIALATLAGWLDGSVADAIAVFGGAILVVHVIELPFVMGHLRRHRGTLAASIALNLLFGLLHWMPLKRAAAANGSESTSWVS
jgi:uncharacterized protein YhhL (DUF1145 family)